MSTITNNAANTIFTSLNNSSANQSKQTGSALLDELTGSNSVQQAAKTATKGSYLLDLSPEAQAFLNTSGGSTASSSANAWKNNFILTSKQQSEINSVIAKYKDAPFTKETYYQMEAELDDLGLSPEALAIKDKARGLNTTSMLLAALNGTGGDLNQSLLGNSSEQSQTKKDNYVKTLLGKWSDISTTIDDAEGDPA